MTDDVDLDSVAACIPSKYRSQATNSRSSLKRFKKKEKVKDWK